MKRFEIALAPGAEQDLTHAFLWYKARNSTAAEGFRSEAMTAIDRLSSLADSKPADIEGNRIWVLRHFPYSIVYIVMDNLVTVIAVAHHRRSPHYWAEK